jgi:hypothetical protein
MHTERQTDFVPQVAEQRKVCTASGAQGTASQKDSRDITPNETFGGGWRGGYEDDWVMLWSVGKLAIRETSSLD